MKRFWFVLVLLATVALLAGCGGGGGSGSSDPINPPVNKDIVHGHVTGNWTWSSDLKVGLRYNDGRTVVIALTPVQKDGSYTIEIPQSAEVIGRYYFLKIYSGSNLVGSAEGSIKYYGYQEEWRYAETPSSIPVPIYQIDWNVEFFPPI